MIVLKRNLILFDFDRILWLVGRTGLGMKMIGRRFLLVMLDNFMLLLGARDVNCQSTPLPAFPYATKETGRLILIVFSVDLETGIKDPHQPYKTLTKYRRIDAGAKYSPCFGMLCVSDKLGIWLIIPTLIVRWR